jgi:hypothetical protein
MVEGIINEVIKTMMNFSFIVKKTLNITCSYSLLGYDIYSNRLEVEILYTGLLNE